MYHCPLCERTFKNLNALKVHFSREHRGLRHCFACNKSFRNRTGLLNHCVKHNDEHHLLFYYLLKFYCKAKKHDLMKLGKYVKTLIAS